ncbi:hypothetical protein VOLCADRAFT_88106 [Volvox carteri f. nagariensis]|uniref:Uncharacterized protein n=1 Tax=Volvox carteri f. nagariensis TaxID=3068 RepID=D8TN35_VOLCA|nr:uncharacterized protein VOLCADRAFT_88106 [Volvox carteri f. nagariensis]EFJ51356.1 hypothetical protein VOLCADRAFT_88106 [Volvox carteri f. nagariensis]|eukprot:XP_002947823.1 hypothetical protein VOLCADRAFT_88106 [Volvox carteri f. nagariensis]
MYKQFDMRSHGHQPDGSSSRPFTRKAVRNCESNGSSCPRPSCCLQHYTRLNPPAPVRGSFGSPEERCQMWDALHPLRLHTPLRLPLLLLALLLKCFRSDAALDVDKALDHNIEPRAAIGIVAETAATQLNYWRGHGFIFGPEEAQMTLPNSYDYIRCGTVNVHGIYTPKGTQGGRGHVT